MSKSTEHNNDTPRKLIAQYSLNQSDRDLLKSAGSKVSTHAGIASVVGLSLGLYAAVRLRAMRVAYFNAFRAMEKPVEVRFADGRTGMFFFINLSKTRQLIHAKRTYS